VASSATSVQSVQRAALINKIETAVTHKSQLGDQGLILHFRLVLRDLPFAGIPSLLLDEHRQGIETLVDRAKSRDIKIFSITGHTSEPGSDDYNKTLSESRAQAAFQYLQQIVDADPYFTDSSFYENIRVDGFGENQPVSPMADESDNPLNRRVEIRYRIKVMFPQPPDGVVPRSRFWKIDFVAGGGAGGTGQVPSSKEKFVVGLDSGLGSLQMLPDDATNQTEILQKPLSYWSLGFSVGILSVLKKLKFVSRFPKVKRIMETLDADLPGNYKRTEDLLKSAGFSVDLVSTGGEFITQEPLSFEEMATFNFAMISGNVSLGAGAAGSLILLHSGNFYAPTVIYGAGLSIAFPDVGLNFVPAAWVQVDV